MIAFVIFSKLRLSILHSISQIRSGQLMGITRLTLSVNLSAFPLEILLLADSLEVLDI